MTQGAEEDDAGRRPAPCRLLEKAGETLKKGIRSTGSRYRRMKAGTDCRFFAGPGMCEPFVPKRFFARTLLKESGKPPSA